MADHGSDLQTDATPEAPCMHQNEEGAPPNLGVLLKELSQPEAAGVTNQSETFKAGSIVDDTSLPISSRRNDCIDILILHASDDYDRAKQMKIQIEQNKFYSETFTPNVTLYDDFIYDVEPLRLDHAVERTVYIFVYLTKLYCDNFVSLCQSHACLTKLLNSKDVAQQVLIPVHTLPNNNRDYVPPLMLNGLRPLNSFNKSFDDDVTRLLEHKKSVIVERRMKSKQTSSKSQDQPKTRNAYTRDKISSVRTSPASFAENSPENVLDQDTVPKKVSDSFNKMVLKKTSTVCFRSSSEPEGDKAVPDYEPSHMSNMQTQEDFSARQVIANPIARGLRFHHHAVEVDSENPSGESQDIQSANIRGGHESSFSVSNNRDTLPNVQVSNTLSNGSVRVDLSQIENRSSGQVVNVYISATNVAYGQHAVMNIKGPVIQQDPEDNSDSYDETS